MPIGLVFYRIVTECLGWIAPLIFLRRAARGKENPDWISQRRARKLNPRPDMPVIWLHGASIGECMLNFEVAKRIGEELERPACFLFTSQTLTAAHSLRQAFEAAAPPHMLCLHQMAPLDTWRIGSRFLEHWRPDMALFAEGEIWPNLLGHLRRRAVPTYLINARMTATTLRNWQRFGKVARHVFSAFTGILASNAQTADGLKPLTSNAVADIGNLKRAQAVPVVDPEELRRWTDALKDRSVLLAASTHAPEEIQLLDAWQTLSPRPLLIIAPRHPERGDALANTLERREHVFQRRTHTPGPNPLAEIVLADTIGEMGLWYRLADTVYLGGGHADGVGGHNPLEPLGLNRPVLTGPHVYNFQDLNDQLIGYEGYTVLPTLSALPQYLPASAPEPALMQMLAEHAEAPMHATLALLRPSLKDAGVLS